MENSEISKKHPYRAINMLENIFLMVMNTDLLSKTSGNHFNVEPNDKVQIEMAYPDEDEEYNSSYLCSKILNSLEGLIDKDIPLKKFNFDFFYDKIRAITLDGQNILITILPHHFILGLVFEKEDNPNLYKNELIKLINEYFLENFLHSNPRDIDKDKINDLLLTLFIDIRKYADEMESHQEEKNHVAIFNKVPMIKAFVYGIDNAGKSSLMRLLATGKFDHNYFRPTKKFRITNIDLESGAKLVCWDMPGHKIFREDWLRGAQSSNILIFVLDLNDQERFKEAKKALWNMLNLYELKGLPLIFLANKIDLVSDLPEQESLKNFFELDKIKDRDYHFLMTSLPERDGIKDLKNILQKECQRLLLLNGLEIINTSDSGDQSISDKK